MQLHLITQQDLLSNFSHKLQRSICVANQAAAKLKATLEGLSKDTADKVRLLLWLLLRRVRRLARAKSACHTQSGSSDLLISSISIATRRPPSCSHAVSRAYPRTLQTKVCIVCFVTVPTLLLSAVMLTFTLFC